jgi:hypothetical protein
MSRSAPPNGCSTPQASDPITLTARGLWHTLEQDGGTVRALADAFLRQAARHEQHDGAWPPSVEADVTLIEAALDTDLSVFPAPADATALIRFAPPTDERVVDSINAQPGTFLAVEPDSWLIQRCVGRFDLHKPDLSAELDRFIAHRGYQRDHPNPWAEHSRTDAPALLVGIQRTSLVWSAPPPWDPGATLARERAEQFLGCFPTDARFFSNADGSAWSFRITPAMFDTGVVVMSQQYAGIWWHAEGDRNAPLGFSP